MTGLDSWYAYMKSHDRAALWGLLPERQDPLPTVPEWPEFMRGCVRYRQSLDEQAPSAPRSTEPYEG